MEARGRAANNKKLKQNYQQVIIFLYVVLLPIILMYTDVI